MGSPKTKHIDIIKYWENKYITKDGEVTDSYSDEAVEGAYEIDSETFSSKDKLLCWGCGAEHSISTFEKCHIVPEMLGGTDTPDNLYILCKKCHKESPDTNNPKNFLRWVYRRRYDYVWGMVHPRIQFDQISEELRLRGYEMDILGLLKELEIGGCTDFSDFKDYITDKIGIHSNEVAESTRIMLMTDYFEEKYKECMANQHIMTNAAENEQHHSSEIKVDQTQKSKQSRKIKAVPQVDW